MLIVGFIGFATSEPIPCNSIRFRGRFSPLQIYHKQSNIRPSIPPSYYSPRYSPIPITHTSILCGWLLYIFQCIIINHKSLQAHPPAPSKFCVMIRPFFISKSNTAINYCTEPIPTLILLLCITSWRWCCSYSKQINILIIK